jgi:hypothetical protein
VGLRIRVGVVQVITVSIMIVHRALFTGKFLIPLNYNSSMSPSDLPPTSTESRPHRLEVFPEKTKKRPLQVSGSLIWISTKRRKPEEKAAQLALATLVNSYTCPESVANDCRTPVCPEVRFIMI